MNLSILNHGRLPQKNVKRATTPFFFRVTVAAPLPTRDVSMPRPARVVIPGLPHHLTHRGNRRVDISRQTEDFEIYLRLLRKHSHRNGVSVEAYSLMPNHVHLVAIPEREESLSDMVQEVDGT